MKTPTILQIYTTGFKKKRDRIFAFGLKRDNQYKIEIIQDANTEEERVKGLLSLLEEISSPIYMYNGKAELSFLQPYYTQNQWERNIFDLYPVLKAHELFIPYPSKKLIDVAKAQGFTGEVHLSEALYLSYYPFLSEVWDEMEEQIQENLEAIEKIARAHENLMENIYGRDGNLPFEIDTIEKKEDSLSIRGRFYQGRNLYFHEESLFYEEHEGEFHLMAQLMHTYYDEERTIYALSYPIERESPLPMPPGYLLMALEGIFYPEQIHRILLDLHQEQLYRP